MFCKSFDFSLISKLRSELMGLAIIGVMLGHIMNHSYQPSILFHLARLIHTPGFLFLSGFGLFYSYFKHSNFFSFYKKRIKRLYLPYFIISLPFFIILLCLGKCNFLQFLGYITTAAFWYEGNYYAMWYIAISLLLYVFFPILYHITFNKYDKPIIFLAIILLFFGGVLYFIQQYFPYYWTNASIGLTKIYIFPIGCYCGYLSYHNKSISFIKLFFLVFICFLLYLLGVNPAVTRSLIGIPIVVLFLNYIFNYHWSSNIKNMLTWMGKYSLELYILHVLIYFTLFFICGFDDGWSMIIGVISAIIICHPVSSIVNRIVF